MDAESMPKRMKLGFDLLKKAGYSGIGGLGKQESGIAEPVSVVVAPESVGLGYARDQQEEDEGEQTLRLVEDGRDDDDEDQAVVIRVVPAAVRDEEVLALAGRWGGVRKYLRSAGTFVLGLAVPSHAPEMVGRIKRQGLKLGGTDVQCFLGSMSLLDEEGAVEVGKAATLAAPSMDNHSEQQTLSGMSLLLQSLGGGAGLTLPSLMMAKPKQANDDGIDDNDDVDDGDVGVGDIGGHDSAPPKSTATANFLQQVLTKKNPAANLLSSINKLLEKKRAREEEEEQQEETARVVADFDAQDNSQVSIRVGDLVIKRYVDEKSGWTEVEFGNSIGWVPSSYLN